MVNFVKLNKDFDFVNKKIKVFVVEKLKINDQILGFVYKVVDEMCKFIGNDSGVIKVNFEGFEVIEIRCKFVIWDMDKFNFVCCNNCNVVVEMVKIIIFIVKVDDLKFLKFFEYIKKELYGVRKEILFVFFYVFKVKKFVKDEIDDMEFQMQFDMN